MSRIISLAALGLLLILAVVSFPLLAADKIAKESPAEAKARQDVKAALRAEAEGDNSQRAERLTSALASAPDLAEANWHLAKVRSGQQWLRLADVEQQAASDAQLAEYRKLRDEAEGSPKLLRGLARWCLKNGWHDTARLHYAQLLGRSDIDEETAQEAIKRMELHHVGGKWVTADELKAQEERTRAIDVALRQWRPRLKRLELAIDGDEYALRERAIKELQAIDDPHAIIAIESFLLDGGDRFCEEAAKALARFPQIEATEALVHFAVLSPFAGARSAAGEGLKNRPKHDYMPLLLSGLTSPITMRFSMSPGSRGMIQFTHTLVQEKGSARVVDVRNQVAYPFVWHPLRRTFSPGRPLVSSSDLVLIAANAAQQAAQELELQTNAVNQESAVRNRPIFDVLEKVADAQLPRDANQWVNWWQDYNQYHWPQQTYYTYQQRPTSYFAGIGMSCFVAGTVVRTQTGMAPIESLKAGDRVLAQNQDSGELSYKLVLRTTIRPPAKMIRIKAGSEQITATLGHPFWVDGHGWKMAKELSASDLLHSLQGAVRIDSIEPAGEDKAYNLVVDDFNTYFVGQQGLLVHDNEFRKPTRAIVPGLIEEAVDLEKK